MKCSWCGEEIEGKGEKTAIHANVNRMGWEFHRGECIDSYVARERMRLGLPPEGVKEETD